MFAGLTWPVPMGPRGRGLVLWGFAWTRSGVLKPNLLRCLPIRTSHLSKIWLGYIAVTSTVLHPIVLSSQLSLHLNGCIKLDDAHVKVGDEVLDLAHPCCHILANFLTRRNAVLASNHPQGSHSIQ